MVTKKLEALTALEKLGQEAICKEIADAPICPEKKREFEEMLERNGAVVRGRGVNTPIQHQGYQGFYEGIDYAAPGSVDKTALATYMYNEQGKPVLLEVESGPEAIARFEQELENDRLRRKLEETQKPLAEAINRMKVPDIELPCEEEDD